MVCVNRTETVIDNVISSRLQNRYQKLHEHCGFVIDSIMVIERQGCEN